MRYQQYPGGIRARPRVYSRTYPAHRNAGIHAPIGPYSYTVRRHAPHPSTPQQPMILPVVLSYQRWVLPPNGEAGLRVGYHSALALGPMPTDAPSHRCSCIVVLPIL